MKLSSLVALVSTISPAAAFAPATFSGASSTALYGMDGHQIRAARTTFAPGHFETHGGQGAAGRTAISGHEIHAERASYAKPGYGEVGHDGLPRKEHILPHDYHTSFAPGHFETIGGGGDAGRTEISGHEIHAARASYAQPGGYGEIGYDGLPRKDYILPHGYHTSFAPGQIETHSSSSSPAPVAGNFAAPASSSSSPTKKSYGLGGGNWKK